MAAQGLAGLDADKMKLVQDLEIEMMTDMYARLTSACHKKCIPPKVSSNYFLYNYFKDLCRSILLSSEEVAIVTVSSRVKRRGKNR